MKSTLLLLAISFSTLALSQTASDLEAQYKTCARHSIPSDKCTPEIYRQLREAENAPLDPDVEKAVAALAEYRGRLKNPESMQVHTAYLTDDGALCFEIGAQNGMGGVTVDRPVYITAAWTHHGGKNRWLDETGAFGSSDRWVGICTKPLGGKLKPGVDLSEKVKKAMAARAGQ
jgi:hypothetical protein